MKKEYKRPDQCLYPGCQSRSCYDRIVRPDKPFYDEVACKRHFEYLYGDARRTLESFKRVNIEGTRKFRRGRELRGEVLEMWNNRVESNQSNQ